VGGAEPTDAAAAVSAAEEDVSLMRQPWWTAATLRIRAALAALQPGGWKEAAPRWREGVDYAASEGAIGEIAIVLRTAGAVAQHVGETEIAVTLFGAAPPSSAITVLPELFPDVVAELRARAQPAPATAHLVEALTRARSALDAVPATSAPEPQSDPSSAAAELTVDGDTWRVLFNGRPARVRDVKGIGDLAVLLRRPRVEVHALELMGARDVGGTPGPLLDDRARRAYQERIVELQRDIDEARAANDPARADRAELELDALVEQLSKAFGLGSRARSTGSSGERARSAVTYRIRSAIRKIANVHLELGRHLDNSIRTGTWCSYQPEAEVTWRVDDRR
jgi:hypothetical protein